VQNFATSVPRFVLNYIEMSVQIVFIFTIFESARIFDAAMCKHFLCFGYQHNSSCLKENFLRYCIALILRLYHQPTIMELGLRSWKTDVAHANVHQLLLLLTLREGQPPQNNIQALVSYTSHPMASSKLKLWNCFIKSLSSNFRFDQPDKLFDSVPFLAS